VHVSCIGRQSWQGAMMRTRREGNDTKCYWFHAGKKIVTDHRPETAR
jgi:hypothetical protein